MQPKAAYMFKTLTIFFALLLCISNARAQSGGDYISAKFISSHADSNAGLSLTLADKWYTYWRMAGDNGLPPKFDWSGSTNVKDIKIHWPTPSRFTLMDMHSFGYSGNIILPLAVTPENVDKKVTLSLKLDVIVCHEICVPQTLSLSHVIGEETDSSEILKTAMTKVPFQENTDALHLDTAVLGKDSIVVTAFSEDGFASGAELIIETQPPLLFAPPEIIADADSADQAILKIKAPQGMDLPKELFGKEATILLIHGEQAIEKKFTF